MTAQYYIMLNRTEYASHAIRHVKVVMGYPVQVASAVLMGCIYQADIVDMFVPRKRSQTEPLYRAKIVILTVGSASDQL
jgi:hypothetical protein